MAISFSAVPFFAADRGLYRGCKDRIESVKSNSANRVLWISVPRPEDLLSWKIGSVNNVMAQGCTGDDMRELYVLGA